MFFRCVFGAGSGGSRPPNLVAEKEWWRCFGQVFVHRPARHRLDERVRISGRRPSFLTALPPCHSPSATSVKVATLTTLAKGILTPHGRPHRHSNLTVSFPKPNSRIPFLALVANLTYVIDSPCSSADLAPSWCGGVHHQPGHTLRCLLWLSWDYHLLLSLLLPQYLLHIVP